MRKVVGIISSLVLAGCACIDISEAQRRQIEELHEQGISWAKNPPVGYQPVVRMGPAICWGILPGAAQIFIADKIGDAYAEGRIQEFAEDRVELNTSGTMMLLFSWFPLVYDGTMPFGIGGVIHDVNRMNNLALLEYMQNHR